MRLKKLPDTADTAPHRPIGEERMTMRTEIIPLADRLDRLSNNQAAHPEYDGAVIRSMARMPIVAYLGGYDIFCDFQAAVGTREDLSYQVTAAAIADQVRHHELTAEGLAEAVSFLAAPIVRIDEAYYKKDARLLPRRVPERAVLYQEHLAWRIENAGTLAGPPSNLHRMPLQRFFQGISGLTGDPGFLDAFQCRILPHIPEDRTLYREAVYEISHLESPERTDLLYKILIEPFAALTSAESEVT